MNYKANIDIVLAIEALKISSFRKQGQLRFRVTLLQTDKSYEPQQNKKNKPPNNYSFCNPYNIYKQQKQLGTESMIKPCVVNGQTLMLRTVQQSLTNSTKNSNLPESFIDHDQECYYSRVFQSRYQSQNHRIQQSCFFRTYIDVAKLEQIQFILKVQLLFAPEGQQTFIEAGTYEATIHKISGISTFLPIIFDQFGGFTINGLYQSTIMEYRFQNSDLQNGFQTFSDYLQAATQGFRKQQLKTFYEYYRKSLQSQLFCIQQRHSDLLRVLNINCNYGFIKVGINQSIYYMINDLSMGQRLLRQRSRQSLFAEDGFKQKISQQIARDFLGLKAIIYQKWNQYIVFLGNHMEKVCQYFKAAYDANVKERLRNNVFSHHVQYRYDWTYSRYEDSGKLLLKQAEMDKQKNKEEEQWRQIFPIQNKNFFQAEGKTIKIFQEIYSVANFKRTFTHRNPTAQTTRKNSFEGHSFSTINLREQYRHQSPTINNNERFSVKPLSDFNPVRSTLEPQFGQRTLPSFDRPFSQRAICEDKSFGLGSQVKLGFQQQSKLQIERSKLNAMGQHIVIFVHGYQASRQDFILFKSCLEIKYKCRVFISSANQGRTEESIQNLGKRLAVQLNNFFKNIDFGPYTRLSFIGHSMGGIIVRSALSYLRNIDQYLYTYMSFSSPHLGYLYQPSALVQAGLWLLNTWQKSQSLDELCMREKQDPRKSLLYRLSQNNSLNGFKNLVLISSSQDEYVPYQSARIQKNSKLLSELGDCINSAIIKEMVDNILGEVRCCQISRMNVVFNIEQSNFDSLVGRTAHVKYLSDQKFIKMFSIVFDKFFE